MSQLARRENAPHRAAFVTSLSRWYIRRLLGNLPPFYPCLSAERRPHYALSIYGNKYFPYLIQSAETDGFIYITLYNH